MSQEFCIKFDHGFWNNTWKIEDIKIQYKSLVQSKVIDNTFEEFFYDFMTAFLLCYGEAFVFDQRGNSHLFKLNASNVAEEQKDNFAKLRTLQRGPRTEIIF